MLSKNVRLPFLAGEQECAATQGQVGPCFCCTSHGLTCNMLCVKKSEADLTSITSATVGGDSLLG